MIETSYIDNTNDRTYCTVLRAAYDPNILLRLFHKSFRPPAIVSEGLVSYCRGLAESPVGGLSLGLGSLRL